MTSPISINDVFEARASLLKHADIDQALVNLAYEEAFGGDVIMAGLLITWAQEPTLGVRLSLERQIKNLLDNKLE